MLGCSNWHAIYYQHCSINHLVSLRRRFATMADKCMSLHADTSRDGQVKPAFLFPTCALRMIMFSQVEMSNDH